MKFFLLALTVCFALAAAEVHWDEEGQYRVVDETPVGIKYRVVSPPATMPYYPYYPFYPNVPYPTAPIPLPAGDLTYPALDARLSLALKEYSPFFYDYKQVKSIL